uniref:Pectinesterase n=1 Tax=Nelumbo nucifera TaxID=4432 RepID=A0A822YRF3_NELNU|nr:TPA_asm: hypothetical protein HUJ06_012820 [Nelumbo nucifera]
MDKLIAFGISLLLIFCTTIDTAVGHHGFSVEDIAKKAMSATMKSVDAICAATDFKDSCIKTLTPVANNASATPHDYLKAAFEVTAREVQIVLEKSGVIAKDAHGSIDKMAVEDCKELLQFAIDELQSAISMVGHHERHKAADLTAELKNWLSAVVSYQESCIDGFEHREVKRSMRNGLLNATQLTSNALTIIGEMSSILEALNINVGFNIKPRHQHHGQHGHHRHLNADGYPTWFAPSDRKLLALQDNGRLAPSAVVAKDGSGQYKTIAEAIAAYPKNSASRYVIYVKAGTYDECITITKEKTNILIRSEGHQAVALRVQADRAAFFNCRMDGYQDTLYVQAHRQFYKNCAISGTIDFIFGDSITLIQDSTIIIRRPLDNQQNTVTAQGKKLKGESSALVLQNCKIEPEPKLVPERPEGWLPWAGNFALDTLFYAEYNNVGPGANTNQRVKWKGFKVITNRDEALPFTAGPLLQGNEWLPETGIPVTLGLSH